MVTPYISYGGDCKHAFELYETAFNGKIHHMLQYKDLPENPEEPLRDEQKEYVAHAFVALTESGGISGSDVASDVVIGNAMSIHVLLSSTEALVHAFKTLSEKGTIVSEIISNPPPDDNSVSACVIDEFGVMFVLSAVKKSQKKGSTY